METPNLDLCPICEEGTLTDHTRQRNIEYNDHSGPVAQHYSACDSCGSDQLSYKQIRVNKRAMIAFRKSVDGLLTGTELRAIRENLGLNQRMAANLFGGGPVAFSKYENDDVTQSVAMDRLIRLANCSPKDLTLLCQIAKIPVLGDSRTYDFENKVLSGARNSKTSVKKNPAPRLGSLFSSSGAEVGISYDSLAA